MKDRSKVIKQSGYRWASVPVREYKSDESPSEGVTRQILLGEHDEQRALRFITRYFEIRPGGYSSLEKHHHPHSVVVVRGTGTVILGDHVETIGPLDCVYVAPECFHQFRANDHESLGFLCIVDRERDRPRLPNDEELRALREVPDVARRMKR